MSPASAIAAGFFTSAATGILAALLLAPFRDLGRFFFALNGGITFCGLALGAPLRGDGMLAPGRGTVGGGRIDALAHGMALALTLLYLVALYLPRRREHRGLLAVAAAGALLAAALDGWRAAGDGPVWAFVASAISGALLLGFVIVGMNVGHWYLVRLRLPVGHLVRFATALGAVIALRAVTLAAGVVAMTGRSALGAGAYLHELAVDRGFFFWQRVLFGILGPAAFAYMIRETARIRSTQSATGILYIAIIFVVIGELLARYLMVAGAGPL